MRVRPSQRAYTVEYYRRNRDAEMERVRVRQVGRILAEAAKCDIVCANCHRSRTERRRCGTVERE